MPPSTPQDPAYLCAPSAISTAMPNISPATPSTPQDSSLPTHNHGHETCPQTDGEICSCQKADLDRKKGKVRTYPRTRTGSIVLSDRDARGRPIEKGPKCAEDVVDMGRAEYLMTLQERQESAEVAREKGISEDREGIDVWVDEAKKADEAGVPEEGGGENATASKSLEIVADSLDAVQEDDSLAAHASDADARGAEKRGHAAATASADLSRTASKRDAFKKRWGSVKSRFSRGGSSK